MVQGLLPSVATFDFACCNCISWFIGASACASGEGSRACMFLLSMSLSSACVLVTICQLSMASRASSLVPANKQEQASVAGESRAQ